MTRPTFKRQAFVPEPFTVAFCSDPHLQQNQRVEHWETAASWLRESPAIALVVGGDLNGAAFVDFAAQQNLSMPIYPVPGNWDANQLPTDSAPIAPDPFSGFRVTYPDLFGSRDWYCRDIEGRLRIIVCQNNSPHFYNGEDTYDNCNPDSPVDYSGWCDPLSEQRLWLDARIKEWTGDHVMVCAHRPAWAPYEDELRPLHPCQDAWRVPVQRSIGKTFIAAGGDIHVGSHCRITEFGCTFDSITASGAYVERAVVEGVVPYLWVSGRVNPPTYKVHVHFLEYFATWVHLRVVEISDDDPSGSIVHEATIQPVTGGET